jgi:hypothetical protein
MSTVSDYVPLAYLGGLTAVDIWKVNPIPLIPWGLMIVAPRWKHTPTAVTITAVFFSIIYTLVGVSLMTRNDAEKIDFVNLEGVVRLFQTPNYAFFGWIHFLCFDGLVGRMILLESLEFQAHPLFHYLVVAPTLLLTFLFGPSGLLLYMLVVRPLMTLLFQRKTKKD